MKSFNFLIVKNMVDLKNTVHIPLYVLVVLISILPHEIKSVLDSCGTEGWTTPIYHPRANPVEHRNQELKKVYTHTRSVTEFFPAVLVLGRECRRPGDWSISPATYVHINTLDRERSARDQRVSGIKPTTNGRRNSKFSEGDVVYYKLHHLSKSSEGFHAGFVPKW